MNKKLQTLTEAFTRELEEHLPGVQMEVQPHGRKSAYIYMTAPDKDYWENESVLDILEGMGKRQIDTLVETGYSIHLLSDYPLAPPSAADLAVLRERMAKYQVETPDNGGAGASHAPNA
jgi:hypothetical protein